MDLRFFLFFLKYVQGIGNKGCLAIYHYCVKNNREWLTPHECLYIGNVSTKYRQVFCESFTTLLDQVDYLKEIASSQPFLLLGEVDYPKNLAEIYNPPYLLFYRGNLGLLDNNLLAMIGSRNANNYAMKQVDELLPELVMQEVVTVSGLAKGIDSYVHQRTIYYGGHTIGVLGCGLDEYYPKENQHLQSFMKNYHLVFSEYPAKTKPARFRFPERNRIIAGLSRGTLVLQARKSSGTAITAQIALEEGRDIFAVSGHGNELDFEGCHELIQAGAKLIWKPQHILEEWL